MSIEPTTDEAALPPVAGSAAVLRWAERVLAEKGAFQRIMLNPGDSPSDPEFCTALAVAAGASYKIVDGKITTQPTAIQFDGSRWVVGLPNR
jgi:hypothetical protein